MRRRLGPMLSLAGGLALLALAVPMVAGASPAPAVHAADSAVNPVSLIGEGSDDPYREMTTWERELFGSSGKVSTSYIVVGGYGGRQNYLNGIGNFVISGEPFTASDLSRLPGGASSLISAPVMVSAVGYVLAWGPTFTLHRSCAAGDNSCKPTSIYDGPIDIPSSALTDMLWPSISDGQTCGCFSDPDIVADTAAAVPQGRDTAPPTISVPTISHPPLIVLRSDPSETNYNTQLFAATGSPEEFSKITNFTPPITEFLQGEADSQFFTTYDGIDSQLSFATSTSTAQTGAAASHGGTGVVVGVPPSAMSGLAYYSPPGQPKTVTPPPTPPVWIGVQNAAGQFATPNPASIDAAVNAGGDTPLYALSHPVRGSVAAYPLVYVDRLYAPSHGLSADQAEAMATVIRYMATVGQDATSGFNDGRLSPGLTQEALAAANQVIASNCTASNEEVVIDSSIGRYAPVLGALGGRTAAQRTTELAGIGPMLHCEMVTSPSSSSGVTTTTSPLGPTGPTSVPSSPGSRSLTSGSSTPGSGSSGPGSSTPGGGSSTPGGATLGTGTSATGKSGSGLGGPVTLASLPLPFGLNSIGYNRLAGLALGGAGFLLLWRSRRSLGKVLTT